MQIQTTTTSNLTMKSLFEKRVLSTLRLTDMQKKVMTRIMTAPTPKTAYDTVSSGRQMLVARDILLRLRMIEIEGEESATVTDTGKKIMTDLNIIDDMGELTDEGNEFAYDEDKPMESLIKQINMLAESKMAELDAEVDKLIVGAESDFGFAPALNDGDEREVHTILSKESNDPVVVAHAMAKLFSGTKPEDYM